ncbi:MAG: hypothetical protein PHP14_02090 [Candidatus Pacebacteria bacterium]|nr:hypothetical protein [Candidatus Paceibacterota bacterium]
MKCLLNYGIIIKIKVTYMLIIIGKKGSGFENITPVGGGNI